MFCIPQSRRHQQHVLHRTLHSRDVRKDVQRGIPKLLRVPVQPLWQLRGRLQHHRGHPHPPPSHGSPGNQRPQVRQAPQGLQGYQVGIGGWGWAVWLGHCLFDWLIDWLIRLSWDGWMDGWMDGWAGRCMDGWIYDRVEGHFLFDLLIIINYLFIYYIIIIIIY